MRVTKKHTIYVNIIYHVHVSIIEHVIVNVYILMIIELLKSKC